MTMTRWRRRLTAEDGFTLVEMVVAMTVAALFLTGGAFVLGSSMKTIVAARANTQAAELISEHIEQLRTADYAAVAMDAGDLSGDEDIQGLPGTPTFDPDGTETRFGSETILTATGGMVNPHISTVVRNDQTYTVARYITTPPTDSAVTAAEYKRLTVIVTWSSGGLTHTRQSSTYLTHTRRGLPLPNFQVTAGAGATSSSAIVVNAGAPLDLPFTVVNRGAPDGFDLAVSSSPSVSMTIAFYKDVDISNSYTSGDTILTDSDSDGTPDTGTMDVDETLRIVAYGTVPASTVAGTYVFTLTATSIGQPSSTGATRTTNFHVTVVNQSSCSGCTYTTLYLRNQYPACTTAPCNTTAQTNMPMRTDPSTDTGSLPNYDTDVDSIEGRALARAASTPAWSSTTSSTMANWRYTVPQATNVNGNLLVDLYVAPMATDVPLTMTAYVMKSTNGSGATSQIGSASATLSASTSSAFRSLRITVPISSTTVANNRFLEVKVVVDSVSSTTGAWLAYDTTTYPSVAWVPVV